MLGCAVVTGGSRGIGKSIALELAKSGMDVMVNYVRDQKSAQDVAEAVRTFGVRSETCQADVSIAEDRSRLVSESVRLFGRIGSLVNNAGIAPRERRDLLDADEGSFDEVLSVDLRGPFFLSRDVANRMVEWVRADPKFTPSILFITSISAYVSSTNRPEYCVAKAGLSMAAHLFADRLAREGIRVYEVRPGLILTDMTLPVREKYDRLIESGIIPQGRWGQADDVGRAVAMLVRGDLRYSTGQVIDVDGGFSLRRL